MVFYHCEAEWRSIKDGGVVVVRHWLEVEINERGKVDADQPIFASMECALPYNWISSKFKDEGLV